MAKWSIMDPSAMYMHLHQNLHMMKRLFFHKLRKHFQSLRPSAVHVRIIDGLFPASHTLQRKSTGNEKGNLLIWLT